MSALPVRLRAYHVTVALRDGTVRTHHHMAAHGCDAVVHFHLVHGDDAVRISARRVMA